MVDAEDAERVPRAGASEDAWSPRRRPAAPLRPTTVPEPAAPLPGELRAWFEDYLEACNRHDLDGVRGFLRPDVRRAGAARGADAWLTALGELLSAFPDHRWKRIAAVVEEDRIAVHLRTRGTHRGTFRGIAPTGRHVSVAEFGIYRVVGGRIAEYAGGATDGSDSALLQQLR